MAFEENDFYRVEIYNIRDLDYFGNRDINSDGVFLDAETAERDGELHGRVNAKVMNSVVLGILKGGIIVQVIRKKRPGDPYADTVYADRAVHELWLVRDSRILAYFSQFDKQITKNLLEQASDRSKADYLLRNLEAHMGNPNVPQFVDIRYKRMSKLKAMRCLGVNTWVPFEDGGLCPEYFDKFLKTGDENYIKSVCERNLSCLVSEFDIVDEIKKRGEWWLN